MATQTTIEMSPIQNDAFHELLKQIKRECRSNFRATQLRFEFLKTKTKTKTVIANPILDFEMTKKCWSQAIAEYKLELLSKKNNQ